MIRIYIAGAWVEQHERARPMIAKVREAGFIIIHDWTKAEGDICASDGDSQLTADERRKFASADLDGVLTADVVWLLAAENDGARGSWVEFGAALAARALWSKLILIRSRPFVIVSGAKSKRTIFTELADHIHETDEEALAWLVDHYGKIESNDESNELPPVLQSGGGT